MEHRFGGQYRVQILTARCFLKRERPPVHAPGAGLHRSAGADEELGAAGHLSIAGGSVGGAMAGESGLGIVFLNERGFGCHGQPRFTSILRTPSLALFDQNRSRSAGLAGFPEGKCQFTEGKHDFTEGKCHFTGVVGPLYSGNWGKPLR